MILYEKPTETVSHSGGRNKYKVGTTTHQHINNPLHAEQSWNSSSTEPASVGGSGYCFIVFGRTGTGKIGKFCLKLNFYQV